ncbi:NlpC/P60 family protein [Kocuria massiliensis]|uniref:C40 family peptidase n=1 Tax=Kocuria massiliensis TaxID=1926282 RepID=UPI000A1CEE8B|nr:NlpC/P60 family protein [Kocuria massiliensis]
MKTPRILAAAATLVFACTTTGTAAWADGSSPSDVAHESGQISAGDTAFVNDNVATLWTEPGQDRPEDRPSTTHPTDLDLWNRNLQDTKLRGWLTGHLETQALYGSRVTVTEVSGEWAKVVVTDQMTPRDPRGYPGWMPVRQLVENPSFADEKKQAPRAVVTAKKSVVAGTKAGTPTTDVSFNTELPVAKQSSDHVTVQLPDGGSGTLPTSDVEVYQPGQTAPKPTGEQVVETGQRFLGLRYLWAGMSSYGYDCSGFTSNMYRAHGIDIPRDADAQAEFGTAVDERDLQPGDLLFFAQPGGTGAVHHVGMYMGDGKMIHAPNESTSVSVTDWKTWDSKDEFSGARRML